MLKPKTIIILLFSLLAGLIAVKAFTLATRKPPPPAQAKIEEKKESRPVHAAYSGSVPKGKRVVSILVNEVTGATRALEKGDRVDVIAVADVANTRGGKIARVMLQNVIIHDVEQSFFKKQLTDKVTRKKKTWTLQLLVSLHQAVTLASVDEAATLRLVLRNPGDETMEEGATVFYSPKTGVSPEAPGSPSLPGQIRPGMRAISLPVDNRDGLCNSLVPGDRVDVITSFATGKIISSDSNKAKGETAKRSGDLKGSRIFLQNIEVLSTNPTGNAYADAQKPITQVNLMVTPKQAEKITVVMDASQSSRIRLLLRNPKDLKKISTRGELYEDQTPQTKNIVRIIATFKGTKGIPGEFHE